MKKPFTIPIILIIVAIFYMIFSMKQFTTLKYKDFVFETEIRSTSQGRKIGLMNYETLEKNQAMLFVFKEPDFYGFWMKNMKFSIDILWLDEDYKIVDIKNNVPPCTTDPCIIYKPSKKAKYVLEIYANLTNELNMSTGESIDRQ